MAPKREETFCRDAFSSYLAAAGFLDPHWKYEPNGDSKPPDFELRVADRLFAVEVTALHTQYEQRSGGAARSELDVWYPSQSAAKEVEQLTIENGTLRGGYHISLRGPYDTLGRQTWKEFKDAACEFIRSTQDVVEIPFPGRAIQIASGMVFVVFKFDGQRGVSLGTHGDGRRWGCRVQDHLELLVRSSVDEKAKKLNGVAGPWILLLLDHASHSTEFEYCELSRILAEENNGSAARFESIFAITLDRDVFPLKGSACIRRM